jgi:hypothetical protein
MWSSRFLLVGTLAVLGLLVHSTPGCGGGSGASDGAAGAAGGHAGTSGSSGGASGDGGGGAGESGAAGRGTTCATVCAKADACCRAINVTYGDGGESCSYEAACMAVDQGNVANCNDLFQNLPFVLSGMPTPDACK